MSPQHETRTSSPARRLTLPILAVVSALVIGAFAQAAVAGADDGGRTQVPGPSPVPTPSPVPIPSPSPSPTPSPAPMPYDAGY